MIGRRGILAILIVSVLILWPYVVGEYWLSLLSQILIFGLVALSVDLLLGHAGLFSLCQAAFFSVSAYAVAIGQVKYGLGHVQAVSLGLSCGLALGAVFGLSVRTRGVYFILVTLAMGYIVWGIGYRWAGLTGGDSGITNVSVPSIGGYDLTHPVTFYYFILLVIGVVVLGYYRLITSPFGLVLRGIKSSEERMKSLGYNPVAHLYAAFLISSLISSLGGVLYVYFNKFINPVSASLHVSVEVVVMAILGGTGTLLGPFVGSAAVLTMRNWVSGFLEMHLAVMGITFIAIVLWAPDGLIGLFRRTKKFLSRK
jgi:branched-chain amino acid transport system permease protein